MNTIIQFTQHIDSHRRSVSGETNSPYTGCCHNLAYYFFTSFQGEGAWVRGYGYLRHLLFVGALVVFLLTQGCTSFDTFPKIARAGGTVSLMVGGSEKARLLTTDVTLTDINSTVWDLKALGLVRSVFNLRTDGRANGLHYSDFLDSSFSWTISGHEPVQTILITDIPLGVPVGMATIDVALNVNDRAAGPATGVNLEIIAGVGTSDEIRRKDPFLGSVPVDFARLEPAPHAKIIFGGFGGSSGAQIIGAASLVVDFDEAFLNGDDINVYVPESQVRGSFGSPGAFGATQRMVYWHQDGLQLFVYIVAPQGIQARYLQLFVIHPNGLSGPANLNLVSAMIKGYDLNGDEIVITPTLEYFP